MLARKWRPGSFDEVAGQEHVLRVLINALDNDRLHHAYLFTGTRGVGKTTLARILAKCLNCEQGVSSRACGECSACIEISEGRFIDLIEVDAASRTKVEDTRELLDNVQYLPARGRYKVYLIDEVHMLSTHSFNALLKTLEEPPPHVKFLLATTDPQKLPVTILSRCLQFNLKNLSPERIVDYLTGVLGKENVPFEEAALWALARAADGSMRDALSLTDQGIAHGDGKLIETELSAMLGTIDRTVVLDICRTVAERDGPAVLELVAALAEHAPDYYGALGEMLSIWHRVAVVQAVPGALDNSMGDQEAIRQLAATLSREDVQLFYQICLLGRKDLPLAADPRSGLEMVLLRQLAFQPVVDDLVEPPQGKAPETSGVNPSVTNVPDRGDIEAVKKSEAASVTEQTLAVNPLPEPAAECAGAVVADAQDKAEVRSLDSEVQVSSHSDDVGLIPEMGVALPRDLSPSADMAGSSKPPSAFEGALRDLTVSTFTAEHWLQICHELAISGRLLNTAVNLAFIGGSGEGDCGGQFSFRLDEAHSALYDEAHQQQLAAALGDYLYQNLDDRQRETISVSIEIAPVTVETPYLYRLRKQVERQEKAVQSLRADSLVKELEQRFGGKLLEETVIPID